MPPFLNWYLTVVEGIGSARITLEAVLCVKLAPGMFSMSACFYVNDQTNSS